MPSQYTYIVLYTFLEMIHIRFVYSFLEIIKITELFLFKSVAFSLVEYK